MHNFVSKIKFLTEKIFDRQISVVFNLTQH